MIRTSRCFDWMSSTPDLIPSISRRLTISVNSILRIVRDSSTRARPTFHFARRYFRLSAFGTSLYLSSSFLTTSSAALTLSICLRISRCRAAIFSSVISSSLKTTTSRTVRSPRLSCSPISMTSCVTRGVREMDLITASLPCSIRLAIATSPSRVSSGTVPISRRYMRTGSFVLSSAPGVRSRSPSLSGPSPVRPWSSRYAFSESTTSMPALPNVLNRSSSSSDEVMSAGSSSLTSSYRR